MSKAVSSDKEAERLEDAGCFPRVVLIDTINFCNLRCSMCGRQEMARKGGIMKTPLYQKIINEITAKDKSVRVWLVFFGDPFMLKGKFRGYMGYAKEKGLTDVVVNTNGNLMNEERSREMIDAGLDAVYIGIDAVSAPVYSKLRIGGNLPKVVANVKRLIELKKETGADKPEVFVQFVEMRENSHEKQKFIDFWTGQGAIVKVRPKVSWAGTVAADNLKAGEERHPCYWAMRTMNILFDGRVCLCAVDYDGRFIAGDISKESLENVWLNGLGQIRKMQREGEYSSLPSICRYCLDWQAAKAQFRQ